MDAILISKLIMGAVGVIVMASFMPWTAYSFLTSRLTRKQNEYKEMLDLLGYTKGVKRPAYLPALEKEYDRSDYYLPVAFATVITVLCAIVLIFGPRLMEHPEQSLILNGPSILTDSTIKQSDRSILFGMMIIAFAFVGSYIWSIQYLFRRLATVDLTPSAYYGVGIRIIFSIFVALFIYYTLTDGTVPPTGKFEVYNSPATLALFAFFAGMFPQRALQYLSDKVRFMRVNDKMKADPLPLQMIEGIGLFERTRFLEVGIDNAQNLAKSNFIELIIRTPFNPREIIDWIGQARLYLYFKDHIKDLHNAGVRTIFNLHALGSDEENLKKIATLSENVPLDKLKVVYEIIKNDADIIELKRALERLISGAEKSSGAALVAVATQ